MEMCSQSTKKSDAANKNQASVRRWNTRKIRDDFIHKNNFYKNSKLSNHSKS